MHADANPPRTAWPAYYHANVGRQPRRLFLLTLDRFEPPADGAPPRCAIDLGCGDGTESLILLEQGWQVLAVDQEPTAIERLLARTPPALRPSLTTQVASFHAMVWRPADLIYAGASLPFCPPQHFDAVWRSLRLTLKPGGRFAGHLFGNRDDWTQQQEMSFQRREEAEALLAGLLIEHMVEVEEDGDSFAGPKHWHFFEVIARLPER
jgi:trans-aconitate methyltransferase